MLEGQYPQSWDEYVGQEEAKHQIRTKIKSAQKRGEPLGHVLIAAPFPGIGKTALALLIARELGVKCWVISGNPKPHEIRMILHRMEPHDVLFIDEIHLLFAGAGNRNDKAAWLLHLLENGTLVTPLGEEQVPPVTVIGATTDKDRLSEPVKDRFEIQPDMTPYTVDEAAWIAQNLSEKLLVPEGMPVPDHDTAFAIARAASNRPRWMRRIVMALRDLALADEILYTEEGEYELEKALQFVNVTPDGLTKDAARYLMTMVRDFAGAPVGAAALNDRFGTTNTGLREVEQLLLEKELLVKSKQGRYLSGAGLRRARELAGMMA